jgi:nucleoside-diphosphate-sugar epimerase
MLIVLITGTTGFLGSYLAKKFLQEGYEVIGLHRSQSNFWRFSEEKERIDWFNIEETSLEDIFNSREIDTVFHTACSYGRNGVGIKELFESNFQFGIEILQASINSGVKTFINSDTLLPKNVNPYGLSKSLFVEALEFFSKNIQVVNIKLEHMYGPLDDKTKFVPWLISMMLSEEEEVLLTSGIQKRDFIYIDDVVSGFYQAFLIKEELADFSNFDLCSGNFVKVRDFVELLARRIEEKFSGNVSKKLIFGAKEYRKNEIMEPQLSGRNLSDIGWGPQIPIEKGIKNLLKNLK